MKRALLYAMDAVIGSLAFATIYLLVAVNRSSGTRPLEGTFEIVMAIGFAITTVVSLGISLKAFYGIWDVDKQSKQLRFLYMITFINAFIAYWRIRTGRGFLIRKQPAERTFP